VPTAELRVVAVEVHLTMPFWERGGVLSVAATAINVEHILTDVGVVSLK